VFKLQLRTPIDRALRIEINELFVYIENLKTTILSDVREGHEWREGSMHNRNTFN
jgi:hypothetical protein